MSLSQKTINYHIHDVELSVVAGERGTPTRLGTMTPEHLVNKMRLWQERIITLCALRESLGEHCANHIILLIEDLEESVAICNYVLLKREGRKVPDLASFLEGF